jgi:hypothetical protein
MNGAVNREVIWFTLVLGRSFSLFDGEDIGIFVLALLVLVLHLILCCSGGVGLSVHSGSGIGCPILSGHLILAALFEGYNHPIINHVGDRVTDIAEPSNEISKETH